MQGRITKPCLLPFLFLGLVALDARAATRFHPLGDLPGGDFRSIAVDVSGDGSVVVGNSRTEFGDSMFVWTRERGMENPIDSSSGRQASVNGISADGLTVVGTMYPLVGENYPYRWTLATGFEQLDFGQINGVADTVSEDGTIVVGAIRTSLDAAGIVPGFWDANGKFTPLPQSLGDPSNPSGVSADGSVIVGSYFREQKDLANRWTATEGVVSLGTLSDEFDEDWAGAVSSDGAIVVGTSLDRSTGFTQAWRWDATNGIVGLNAIPPDLPRTSAVDVSADGSVVLIAARDDSAGVGNVETFLWDTEHGMFKLRDLLAASGEDLSEWEYLSPRAISENGRFIVGSGGNSRGQEAWLADISGLVIPEPSADTLALVASSVGLFGMRIGRARY